MKRVKKRLECCFNCKHKFNCKEAVTGEHNPCNRWEQWEIAEEPENDPPAIA